MHSVSFFNRPVNTERAKRGIGKPRKWVSFQNTLSQSRLQPSVKMCHTWNIHFPLFASEQDLSVYPASLPWARFGKCISGCGVPVHRRHPSPLSGGSDKRGRRRVRPLLSSSSNPPTTKDTETPFLSFIIGTLMKRSYNFVMAVGLSFWCWFMSKRWMCRCGSFPGS